MPCTTLISKSRLIGPECVGYGMSQFTPGPLHHGLSHKNGHAQNQTRNDSPLSYDDTYVVVDSSDRDARRIVDEIESRVRGPAG